MKIYNVTDENGKRHTVVAADIPEALDLVARERGALDIADLAQDSAVNDAIAEWDIEHYGDGEAEYYWAKNEGEIVYRLIGHAHGDGLVDSDEAPAFPTAKTTTF